MSSVLVVTFHSCHRFIEFEAAEPKIVYSVLIYR